MRETNVGPIVEQPSLASIEVKMTTTDGDGLGHLVYEDEGDDERSSIVHWLYCMSSLSGKSGVIGEGWICQASRGLVLIRPILNANILRTD